MKKYILLIALIALWPGYVFGQINQDTVNSDVPGGGGSGGGLTESDINTPAKLNAFVTPDLADISGSQTFTNKTIDAAANTIKILKGADCTTFDAAVDGQYCWDTDDDLLYVCETADVCDTVGEWDAVATGGSIAMNDITDVTETTPQDNDVLHYDTGAWVNIAPPWLPLAGGTLTGQLVADNLGIEFEDSDTNPTCSAGNYNIYADLSETSLKACTNGSASKLATFADLIDANIPNDITIDLASNATTADALSANPDNCSVSGQKAVGIAADGTAECAAIDSADVTFSSADFDASVVGGASGAIQELYDELNTPCGDGPNSATCSWVDFSVLDNVPEFSIPSGTNPAVDGAGDAAIDTTAGQFVYYGGSAVVVLTGQQSKCAVIESVTESDDNMMFGSFNVPVTINSVWCQYNGSAPSTVATFTLEDGGGNAMTITGSNPTCTGPGTNPTPAAVTAGNALAAYELLRFDTTNTPDPATDTYMICVGYTYDRQ